MSRKGGPVRAAAPVAEQPQRLVLGAPRPGGQASTRMLDRLAERLARRLRGVFEPLVRCNVRVEAAPVVIESYGEWLERQPPFLGLAQFGIEPLGLPVMSVLQPATVIDLLDRYFGGEGRVMAGAVGEFTLAEERMARRIASAAMVVLTGELPFPEPGEAKLKSQESNPQFAMCCSTDEAVAVAGFTVAIPGGTEHRIDLILSQAVVRLVEGSGRSDAASGDAGWAARLFRAAETMHFDARVVVARPDITLRQLMALKAGDVLPTIVPSVVPLIVAGRTIAHGTIGDSDGRAALRIERLEHRSIS